MTALFMQRNEQIHNVQKNGYIEVEDFLEQIMFLYRNVPEKDKYYIKMMNKYDYLEAGAHSEMVRLDKIIRYDYADWYLHCPRDNAYITQQPDVLDLYHSLNLYGNEKEEGSKKISMSTDNIEKIVGLMIDIDIQKSIFSNLDAQQLYDFLVEEGIVGGSIPAVNAIVYSGAGIHLIIKFKYPVNATEKSKNLVTKMQNCFANIVREQLVIKEKEQLKVDILSLTTSTRVNTSYNSKNFNRVKFAIVNEELQELRELQAFFDEVKPYSRKKNNRKIVQLGMAKSSRQARKIYVLLEDRKNDLKKLQQSYPEHCFGNEEKMCFLYCNFTVQQLIHNYIDTAMKDEEIAFEDIDLTSTLKKEFFNTAFEETLEFNNDFVKPYKIRQIRSKMNILTKKNYKFGTSTIINWLNIHEDIQWNLKTIASPEVVNERNVVRLKRVSEQRKADRRNENGLTKQQQKTEDLKVKVLELREQGLSIRKIAEKLGKSKGSIENVLKK